MRVGFCLTDRLHVVIVEKKRETNVSKYRKTIIKAFWGDSWQTEDDGCQERGSAISVISQIMDIEV